MSKKTELMVFSGVMTALTVLATAYLKIPFGGGYIHLGDGVIFFSAVILGPYAAISSAIGSAFADVLAGFASYAPATFVIKLLMGLTAGLILMKLSSKDKLFSRGDFGITVIAVAAAEIIMLGGYFLYELFIFNFATAVSGLIGNLIQAGAGIALGLMLAPVAKRLRL